MSAAKGVDYITRDFSTFIEESPADRLQDPQATVVGNLLSSFETTGTRNWHKNTVEWFLVFLLTEFAVTPHNMREGFTAASVLIGYQAVLRDLVISSHRLCWPEC